MLRRSNPSAGNAEPRVLLWPDTFTNYLSPQVGRAAIRVLESAGLAVGLPGRGVCCGLTWISTGQLGIARRVLQRTLKVMAEYAERQPFVVGLEPSCTAALRKDLPELFPDDPVAAWLSSHVLTFAEALDRLAPPDWGPQANRASISQTHCHQHAVLGVDADRRLMNRVGIDNTILPAACCGLAGNFGFERGHYDISMTVGESVLLPAVRSADPQTIILADGFSCRTQIEQATDRHGMHLAELIDHGLNSEVQAVSSDD
jgi:Fe-S oxidoreductase